MFAQNKTPQSYSNALNKLNRDPVTGIKAEPCDVTYCDGSLQIGLVRHNEQNLTKTFETNDYRSQNTNDVGMLTNGSNTKFCLSQNASHTWTVQVGENVSTGFNETDALLQRAEREFVPIDRKDSLYWSKRIKNNDSARRSRMKRKSTEKDIIDKFMSLQKENIELKYELASLNRHIAEQLDQTQLSESSNLKSCVDEKFQNSLPRLASFTVSNIELPSSDCKNSPEMHSRKIVTKISKQAKQYFREQNTYEKETIDKISSSKYGLHSQENTDSETVHVGNKPVNFQTSDYHRNSCEMKDKQVANDNEQETDMGLTSTPVIVNVFSLRTDISNSSSCNNNSWDSRHDIQSVPHKYRHKRGFHSAFAMQS